MTAADDLRAQKSASTDPARLEREAQLAEQRDPFVPYLDHYKPKRPLLHRLVDLEHVLKLENYPIFALDVREAIETLERLTKEP